MPRRASEDGRCEGLLRIDGTGDDRLVQLDGVFHPAEGNRSRHEHVFVPEERILVPRVNVEGEGVKGGAERNAK